MQYQVNELVRDLYVIHGKETCGEFNPGTNERAYSGLTKST